MSSPQRDARAGDNRVGNHRQLSIRARSTSGRAARRTVTTAGSKPISKHVLTLRAMGPTHPRHSRLSPKRHQRSAVAAWRGEHARYDPQGNITNRNTVPHDFDYGNRLRSVGTTETYRYDGHGRRVQTTQGNGSLTLWMYAQSGQMLFSFKGPSNQTTHENVYLAGSLVATIDHAWPSNAVIATKYQHTDALGSPVAVSNEAGTVIERTNYDPYGGPIGKTVNGMGYTGHVMDGATGLTYMQQRYYDQGVGRFLSIDPIAVETTRGGGSNRYWYASNNPYYYVDPDGRKVNVAGAEEDIDALEQEIFNATGIAVDTVDGMLQQVGERDTSVGSADAAEILTDALNASESITLAVVNAEPYSLFDSYETNKVDVADLQSISEKSTQLSGAILSHVIAERMQTARTGQDFYGGAHDAGLKAELKVMNADSRRDYYNLVPGGYIRWGYYDKEGASTSLFEFSFDERLTPR